MEADRRRSVPEIVVEIVSGEGGADSRLFVSELASAYTRYARSLGLAVSILASRDGHMTLLMSGVDPWGAFRHEPGKHACQRVPETESRGRRHTSLVSVAVMPVARDAAEPLDEEDIEITTCGGHGPGGSTKTRPTAPSG